MELIELDAFPNIAAGAPFTLSENKLKGMTVFGIGFEMGGTTFDASHISELQIRYNGKYLTPPDLTGTYLTDMNGYNGVPDPTNYLFWWFGDRKSLTAHGQWLGAFDMSVYGSNPLEIKGKIDASASAPTLQAFALVGPPKAAMPYGYSAAEQAFVRALIPTTVQPAAAVSYKAYPISLGSDAGARMRALHFFHTYMTDVNYKRQGLEAWERVSVARNQAVNSAMGRTVASGHYVLDRINLDNQGDSDATLDGKGNPLNLTVQISTSAGDTIDTFADVITAVPLL